MNTQTPTSREKNRSKKGRRRRYIIIGLVALIILVFGAIFFNKRQQQSQEKPRYNTMTVSKQADFVLTGKIQASQHQVLNVPEGELQRINVNNGDHVIAGQALLTSKQTVSQDDADDNSNNNSQTSAAAAGNNSTASGPATTTIYRTLTAPYSGYLQIDNSKQGAPVLTLYSDGLQFSAEVSEYDYAKLHNGTPLHVKALATNHEQTTPLSYLSVIPSKNSGSNNTKYQVTANVDGQKFMNGQTAKAAVNQAGVRIPKSAVKNGHVFVVDDNGRARRVKVSGHAVNSYYLVDDGLDEGDKIVTNPGQHLKNHQKVNQHD